MSKAESPARQKWREIIERQQASGLSIAAFCRDDGVPASSFFAWKRRLAASPPGVSAAVPTNAPAAVPAPATVTAAAPASSFPGFVEATVPDIRSAAAAAAAAIQVRLRGGRRLLVGRGFDRDLLAEVVAFFEGRS